jgi:hydroxyethylthiazole kinase-like uncharacterized protein yjeF
MIVSGDKMRALEEAAFASGYSPENLMESAGAQIAQAVRQFFPQPGSAVVFYGKGHNGGDALVAARHLAESGWAVTLRPQESDQQKLSDLTRKKLAELKGKSASPNEGHRRPLVILDGLLGIGAKGPLRCCIRELTRKINALRQHENAHVFAIDLPTGLDGDSGETDPDAVTADFTLTIGFAKQGLVSEHAANHVGRLALLPLPQLGKRENLTHENGVIATPASLAELLPRRKTETHKTQYGRIGIVAGSVGFTGAALLAAQGALHAGAGLVSLYAPKEIQPTLAAAASPEIMVKPIDSYLELLDSKRDVIAMGPGLGTDRADEILQLIEQCDEPMVLDADALNILSKGHIGVLAQSTPGTRLLTPHPGEMARLFEVGKRTRSETVRAFTEQYPVALLLKGARTIVSEKGQPLSYNSTGSPGMASGGMGDALTGVCAALIGQGLSPFDAGRLGAWVCGRAAELAIFNGPHSEESLSAMTVIEHLGNAFKQLRNTCF